MRTSKSLLSPFRQLYKNIASQTLSPIVENLLRSTMPNTGQIMLYLRTVLVIITVIRFTIKELIGRC